MSYTTLEQTVHDLAVPIAEDHNARLVDVRYGSGALDISVEKQDGGRMTLDECAKISRELAPLLDVEDVIQGSYRLEVGSPGIDRPLKTAVDFETYIGFDVKAELQTPNAIGQRKFRGRIENVDDNYVFIKTDQQTEQLALNNIGKAKLVLSDALISATKPNKENKPET